MNFNSKSNGESIPYVNYEDVINIRFSPMPNLSKSYTFKSEKSQLDDKAEYSIIYSPGFTYGMTNKTVPKLDPPIVKGVFKSSDIKNWKEKYKQLYKQLAGDSSSSDNKCFAPRDVKWSWMESKVPQWQKLLISLHKEIRERFKGLPGLTKESTICVFLDKDEWKNFKSEKMKDIKLINCGETKARALPQPGSN